MLLNEKAILVSPIIKKWNPRKVDKALRDAVASEYGVDSKMLSTSKKLVALNEGVFKRIETVDKKIRTPEEVATEIESKLEEILTLPLPHSDLYRHSEQILNVQ